MCLIRYYFDDNLLLIAFLVMRHTPKPSLIIDDDT